MVTFDHQSGPCTFVVLGLEDCGLGFDLEGCILGLKSLLTSVIMGISKTFIYLYRLRELV